MKWANDTFVKPCQLLSKLSGGYPNLTTLYTQHVLLLSSIKCICRKSLEQAENCQESAICSSLCDDVLSALVVLASGKDLVAELSNI